MIPMIQDVPGQTLRYSLRTFIENIDYNWPQFGLQESFATISAFANVTAACRNGSALSEQILGNECREINPKDCQGMLVYRIPIATVDDSNGDAAASVSCRKERPCHSIRSRRAGSKMFPPRLRENRTGVRCSRPPH